jgi:hypothetical protein
MSLFSNSPAAFCEKEGRSVRLDQTEGRCRDTHRCGDDPCPLECRFGEGRFASAIEMLAASLGQAPLPRQGK